MADIIDLGEAARLAKLRTENPQPKVSTQEEREASPIWASFQAIIANERANGRVHPKKTVDLLWGGYSAGYQACAQAVSHSFQTGNFTLEGHPPEWWTKLRDLAQACVDDPTSASEGLLSVHLLTGAAETMAVGRTDG